MKEKKRPKVLFVMQLPPPVHGASVMNEIVHKSKLLNASFKCDHINLATARDIDDLQKNRFSKYLLTLSIVFRTLFKLVFNSYDCVYVTLFPYGPAFVKDSTIVGLSKLFSKRVVLHLHTYGFKENSERNALWKKYYRYVFRNTGVICLSPLLVEDIENLYNGPVSIVPNGIPQVNFTNTYNNRQQPVNLLFLSNLIAGKGIMVLIDALEIVNKNGIDFRLRVVGAERDITYLQLKETVMKKGLDEKVNLLGPRFEEDKYEEFRKAGIFILPSNYDTFGLVLLEAMQFGIPCISTNIGGIPDVLGEGRGLIIPAITATEIAKAVEFLIQNPGTRADMSIKGFNYFEKNFKVQVFEERLRDVINGKPGIVNESLINNPV